MRKVVFYGAVSLDGYLAAKNDSLEWLFATDLAGTSTYEAFEKQVTTMVMGRVTYEEVLKLMADQPLYPGKEKVVFSHRAREKMEEVTFVADDPVAVVRELQQQEDPGWIWIVGGGGLLIELIAGDLIDEYWIQIAPVLLGAGKPLFPAGNYRRRLEYVETTQMGELVELHYRKPKES